MILVYVLYENKLIIVLNKPISISITPPTMLMFILHF